VRAAISLTIGSSKEHSVTVSDVRLLKPCSEVKIASGW